MYKINSIDEMYCFIFGNLQSIYKRIFFEVEIKQIYAALKR